MTTNSNTLKISPLLAQFLNQHKELNLQGIGKFRLEAISDEQEYNEKSTSDGQSGLISFQFDTSTKEDYRLVEYISSQTGKMKSLASSDLDSHLELAKQFLNIGKPFLIEGIGVLTKNKSNKLEFTPGNISNENIVENESSESDQHSASEKSFAVYEEMLTPKKPMIPVFRKLILLVAVISGIGLAIWGGFIIYKKTNKIENGNTNIPATELVSDTIGISKKTDLKESDTRLSPGTKEYKFVIEKADSNRAFTRYTDLKNYGLDILIERNDSITYTLYFKLAISPSDTARVRDSLSIWYGTRSRTTIEN